MNRIILLFVVMLSIQSRGSCQSREIEYVERKIEYKTDSTGRSIPIIDPEYYRVHAKDNSSWGYKSRDGEIVIPLGKYKFLNPIDDHGMILAHKDGKEGFIDIHENIIIPFTYDDVGVFSECVGLAPVIKDGKQGFINRKGDLVIPLEYDAKSDVTYFYEPGEAILVKNGRYGVIDGNNNVIIPFEFDKIKWSANKDSFVVIVGNEWTSFSFDGKRLSDYTDYEIVTTIPLGALPRDSKDLPVLVVRGENKHLRNTIYNTEEYMNGNKRTVDSLEALTGKEFAYIDKAQNIIIPFGTYDSAEPFGLGRKAIVGAKGRYGIIDEHGKPVLPLEYDLVERPSQYSNYANIFVATKGNSVTIFDKDAKVIPIGSIISYEGRRGSSLIVSHVKGHKGLVNYDGELTIPMIYDDLSRTRIRGYIARKGDIYGYISHKNEILKPFEYKYIYELRDDLVYINMDGKAGMYNKVGGIKLPFEYEAIYDTWYNEHDYFKTRYIVVKDGKVGTVDMRNNVVIPIIYDGLSGWVEYGPEAHFVKNDCKYGLISHEGRIIIPIEYDYVGLPSDWVIVVRKNGKYGVISWQNKEIMPCIYDRIIDDIPFEYFEDSYAPKLVTLKDGIWSYFDLNGKLMRANVHESEISDKYGYILDWGEPSNEGHDFDMRQASTLLFEP